MGATSPSIRAIEAHFARSHSFAGVAPLRSGTVPAPPRRLPADPRVFQILFLGVLLAAGVLGCAISACDPPKSP